VPLKVAVTGGTGFVGTAVVSELLLAGHEVRVFSRKAPDRLPEGVRHVVGSIVTGEGLETLLEGTDAVIHLVGIIKEARVNSFEAVHHQGTVNVLLAASRADVHRYLHMSAMGTREGAVSRYHRSKWAGEVAVRASGLDWTIFRPSTIFGPGDVFINMLAGMMRKTPVLPVIGGERAKMQPVFVNDVAAAFRTVLESEVHIGSVYELGGPDVLNLMQILEIVSQVIDKKLLLLPIPFQIVAHVVKLAQLMGITMPVTSDQLIMLGEDNIRTGGDPVEELGVSWTPFEDGIRHYLGSSV
jgi:uncharacterized protein YbjT (DUF2867 family)